MLRNLRRQSQFSGALNPVEIRPQAALSIALQRPRSLRLCKEQRDFLGFLVTGCLGRAVYAVTVTTPGGATA